MQNKLKIKVILLWVGITTYVLYFSLIAFIKFRGFLFYDFDLAVHALSAWNLLRGSLFNSILDISYFGNHVHLITLFCLPFFALLPHPLTLLVLQTVALGSVAAVLYYLAKTILDERWALVVAFVYLLNPALGYLNLFEFHPTAFAALFLTLTMYYYYRYSFIGFCICMVLSMLCQENIPAAILMCALLARLNRREKKWIFTPLLAGFLYLIFALRFMAHGNQNTVQYALLYSHLGDTPFEIALNFLIHPMLLLRAVFRLPVCIYLAQVFIPVFFVPLLSPLAMLPAVPFFLQHILSRRPQELSITAHYLAEIIPFIFIGFVFGIKRLRDGGYISRQKFMQAAFVVIALLSNFVMGPHFSVAARLLNLSSYDRLNAFRNTLVKHVSGDASVVATFAFLPHLTNRSFLYSFHHVYMGLHTLSSKPYVLPAVDTALLDFNDFLTFKGFYRHDNYKNLQRFFLDGKWRIEGFLETIVLCKKSTSGNFLLTQRIQKPLEVVFKNKPMYIDDSIVLQGYDVTYGETKDTLEISCYWVSERATDKDINLFLDIIDQKGRLLQRKFLPIGYRIFPTYSWVEGEWYKDLYRICIPSFAQGAGFSLKIGFFDYRDGHFCRVRNAADSFGRVLLAEFGSR